MVAISPTNHVPSLMRDLCMQVFHKHNIHNTTIQPEFVDDCNTNAEHCHEPVCEPGKSASCETAKAHR